MRMAEARGGMRWQFPDGWAIAWSLVALVSFYLAWRQSTVVRHLDSYSHFDYPIPLISGLRILGGERPYRDFQVLYGPLGYYPAAVALWLGRTRPVAFAYNNYILGCLMLLYGLVCGLVAKLRLRRPLLLVAVPILIVLSAHRMVYLAWYSLPMVLPVLIASLTIRFAAPSEQRSKSEVLTWQLVTAALLAAQMFLRFNLGLYLGGAIGFVGCGAYFFGDRKVAYAALRCLGFAVVFLALFAAAFSAAGILGPFLDDLKSYVPRATAGRKLRWQYVDHVLFFCTALSLIATLLRYFPTVLARKIDFGLVPYILLVGFFSYTFLRFDALHLVPFLALSLLLLANPSSSATNAAFLSWRSGIRWFGLHEIQAAGLLILLHAMLPVSSLLAFEKHVLRMSPPKFSVIQPQGLSGQVVPVISVRGMSLYPEEVDMLQRLQGLRKANDEIFWMSTPRSCHSTFDMCVNISLYLAEGILPRQYVWYFDTVTTPYPDVQQRIVDGLEDKKTAWVGVQDVYVPYSIETVKQESTLLIDYVRSHYSPVFTVEIPEGNRRYTIYSRRTEQ